MGDHIGAQVLPVADARGHDDRPGGAGPRPALRRIGEEWCEGRLTIAAEHRASAIVERILGEHHPAPSGRRRRRRGTAVTAALAGDRHGLPVTMAAVALREDNWHVHHLGADLPGDELMRFCEQRPSTWPCSP